MKKWQEEIKELRLVDASNEEASALLNNARFLLQILYLILERISYLLKIVVAEIEKWTPRFKAYGFCLETI
ncbi:Expansin [Gossypium australe]|uniref:Expansin n=1 Tax=Gossypium australe TaxID=47621 RepID=A0A5B6UQY6_9ROSI|nr:Expansin [Gossypium australe]